MTRPVTRRQWLAGASAALAPAVALASPPAAAPNEPPFRYCLNTSTISGQKLDLVEVVDVAARAGYQAIEPWVHELDRHAKAGGSLAELGKRLRDRGLAVAGAIGFSEWAVDDPARRRRGLEDLRRSMDLVRQVGGTRIAAPPAGATNPPALPLEAVADRYRAILELGDRAGVVPQVELWGFSQTLRRLADAAWVAVQTGHPKACVLADVYHLYKGGSPFDGLRLLNGSALHVLHFDDYPARPPRESVNDAQRVYPGDGVAPLATILYALRHAGFRGYLSLELFNRSYWKQDALTVARTGLEKMRAVVSRSLRRE